MIGLNVRTVTLLAVGLFLIINTFPITEARLREGECEVCLKLVASFKSSLSTIKSQSGIEDGIRDMCSKYTDRAEKRFCYYIGGSEDSATSLLRTISTPIKDSLPTEVICERLKKADGQICSVHYEKPAAPIDWSTIDLNKMRVKELKHILDGWNEKCDGCTEKGDYLRLINQVKDKHIPQQAQKDL